VKIISEALYRTNIALSQITGKPS